ncbi:hypothetical protein FHW79_006452 [Azospirillum sp. OGB3]|uniref:hypothetical protein n=1 Tax=Azospirillum sp. OGB3 TaxID=2587012 RepID=UPI0016059D6D|nr:hypothetical protein [Azospirillum sp. OGB3]MBB3268777.1 hypothetical protein [Azospirillum sp. OGB3]
MAADTLEDERKTRVPVDVRARRDIAKALTAWAAHGYPVGNGIRVLRARATLDLQLPDGILSRAAMKLADLLLAHAYAAGANASTVRVALPDLAAFLKVFDSGRPPRPGEIMTLIKEIAAAEIVWNATGADRSMAEAIRYPAIENPSYDGERWLNYAVPEPLRPAVVSPRSYVRLDLGAVRACRTAFGVRVLHLAALYAPAADRFRRTVTKIYTADELAAMIGYKRPRVRPSQLMSEAVKGALNDVPRLPTGPRLVIVRPVELGGMGLDGKAEENDPRLFRMTVHTTKPRKQSGMPGRTGVRSGMTV